MPKPPRLDPDAEALREIVNALIEGGGRGQLTYIAKKSGMATSGFRKRLRSPGSGFDGPTLLTFLYIQESRARDSEPLTEETTVGDYLIGKRPDGTAAWRPRP